jgi:hypothetical protein
MLEKGLPISAIEAQLNSMLNDLRTIVDAAITDKKQNPAVHILIQELFRSRLDWMREVSLAPKRSLSK